MSTMTLTKVYQRTNITPPISAFPISTVKINGEILPRVPTSSPPFTLSDIRRSIPPHCFERNHLVSFYYLAYDLTVIFTFLYFATNIQNSFAEETFGFYLSFLLRSAAWMVYWIAQGSVMTGLWVIGHECGHGGFANTTLMNDVVGFIIHSTLLVPYFSWQVTHRKHHSNTANIERDEVFVPVRSKDRTAVPTVILDDDLTLFHALQSITRCFRIPLMLTLGWPLYLLFNWTGNNTYKGIMLNHFYPYSPIFADIKAGTILVILSDLGMMAMLSVLIYLSYAYSFLQVIAYYGIPLLITNLFLVMITFLQHTSHQLPHYDSAHWDWLRGALATVDRDWGILNHVFHHITDTHVAHHLFSSMPHYHAQEATECVKKVLGDYYLWDETPIATAMWILYGSCNEVKPDPLRAGVNWF